MSFERFQGYECIAGVSRLFQTEIRISGGSFEILGGSAKLQAANLISRYSQFGDALLKFFGVFYFKTGFRKNRAEERISWDSAKFLTGKRIMRNQSPVFGYKRVPVDSRSYQGIIMVQSFCSNSVYNDFILKYAFQDNLRYFSFSNAFQAIQGEGMHQMGFWVVQV